MSITWKQISKLVRKHGKGDLGIVEPSDKTCLRPGKNGKVEIHLVNGAVPEHALHELCHFILLKDGTSPWCNLPSHVLEGWGNGTLTGEWKLVADKANEIDHILVEKKMAEIIEMENKLKKVIGSS